MILPVILEGISKAATVFSVLMTLYTTPCNAGGYISVILVLQTCSDSLHIPPGSSSETNATSSDCAYHVGNVKVEEDLDMQEEEGEVNVKREKDIGSDEEECIGTKDDEGMYSEEEEEEDVYIKEEDVDMKEEVSVEDTV